MPSNVSKLASGGESPRPVGDDSHVALDANDLEYLAEEEEQELLEGSASPTPASAKDDGGNGATFMGKLMPPLLTQAPGGQSSSDATLDEANALPSSPPMFGDVNLGADALGRVCSLMLAALKSEYCVREKLICQ